MKEYNVQMRHERNIRPFISYTGAEPEEQVTASLTQQQFFFNANKAQENATIHTYEVAQLIAQLEKPLSDGDFIKQCLTKVVGTMCSGNMQDFNNVRMSRLTVVRRIEDLSANLQQQVSDKACALHFYSIACRALDSK